MDKLPQQATGLERQVLGACMLHVIPVEKLNLTPEKFYSSTHKTIFKAILECSNNGGCDLASVTQYLTDKGTLEQVGGVLPLTDLTTTVSNEVDILRHAKIIEQKFIARQTESILYKALERTHSLDDIADVLEDVKKELSDLVPLNRMNIEIDSRIDPLAEITEAPVYCSIDGTPTMTAGNFSMLDGKKKAGKTFLLGAITASMINNSTQLNVIRGSIPLDKRTVLYFDTEQSRFHSTRSIKRICSLTGNPNPSNLFAYSLRPFTPQERLTFIEEKINKHSDTLAVVIIDGIRDLLTIGINDEAEATSLTSKFLKWTDDHFIHMILLLHQNKTDLNARGHIGTEMLNKAETVISVTKDKSGIFIAACEDSRDIPFDEFAFSIEEGMITASGMPKEEQTKSKTPQRIDDSKHIEVLDHIYKVNDKLNYSELQDAIIYGFGGTFGRSASRAFITHYLNKGWIIKKRDGHKTFYTYTRATF